MIQVSIVGGSGYTGGELLRLLLFHPECEVQQITSERFAGKFVYNSHPNLRGATRLKFCAVSELEHCDLMFLCLPHGRTMTAVERFQKLSTWLIDLSADFRLTDKDQYLRWYGEEHARPELLGTFAYGIPEVNRKAIQVATRVACAGCNATVCTLAVGPFTRRDLVESIVIEVKVGSSEGGNASSDASHHPERSGAVRSYRPTGHRHVGELQQSLGQIPIHFSATSIEMVRGILATCHIFLKEPLDEKAVWKIFRDDYRDEPFVRIVKEHSGIHRYPDPKLLAGSNYCDIGFERDPHSNRLVVMSAIDNLMKGAAGQAVQCLNLMHGFEETSGLTFPGLHPV